MLSSRPVAINHQPSTDISNQQLFEKIRNHFDEKSKQTDTRILTIEENVKNNNEMVNGIRQNVFDMSELFNQLLTEIVVPLMKSIPSSKEKLIDTMDRIMLVMRKKVDLIQNSLTIDDNQMTENEEEMEENQLDEMSGHSKDTNNQYA